MSNNTELYQDESYTYNNENVYNYKNTTCKIWECAVDDGYDDCASIINCKWCKNFSAYLYKLHVNEDECGDYYCNCGREVMLYYLCFKCKKKHDT